MVHVTRCRREDPPPQDNSSRAAAFINSSTEIDDRAACMHTSSLTFFFLASVFLGGIVAVFVVIYFSMKNYEKSNCRLHTVKTRASARNNSNHCVLVIKWNRESSMPSNAIKSTSFGKASAGKLCHPFFYPAPLTSC
jgi:hypothetical protein